MKDNDVSESSQSQNMRETVKLKIEGNIDLKVAEATLKHLQDDLKIDIISSTKECIRKRGFLLSPEDLQFAGALASIFSAIVSVWILCREERERNEWNADRALQAVADKMMANGIADYSVKAVHGFHAFLNAEDGVCWFSVQANVTQEKYDVYLFRDGRSYTLRVN